LDLKDEHDAERGLLDVGLVQHCLDLADRYAHEQVEHYDAHEADEERVDYVVGQGYHAIVGVQEAHFARLQLADYHLTPQKYLLINKIS